MTASLYDTIRRIVADELTGLAMPALAVVQESHPGDDAGEDNYACTVKLRGRDLVLRRVPVATGRIGTVAVPAPGDLVLVAFVGGDIDAPIVLGRLYDDQRRPPASAVARHVTHLPPGAGDGDAVHAEVDSGTRTLVLRLGDGLTVTLADGDPVVTVEVDGGRGQIEIGRDGGIAVECRGAVAIKATEITIQADGALTLKGATVDIN